MKRIRLTVDLAYDPVRMHGGGVIHVVEERLVPLPDCYPMQLLDCRVATVVLCRCGGCGQLHPVGWEGDCRDDEQRFGSLDECQERLGCIALELLDEEDEDGE